MRNDAELRIPTAGQCALCGGLCTFKASVLIHDSDGRFGYLGFCTDCTKGPSNLRNLVISVNDRPQVNRIAGIPENDSGG